METTICKRCGWAISRTQFGWASTAGGLECGEPHRAHEPRRSARQELAGTVSFRTSEDAPAR